MSGAVKYKDGKAYLIHRVYEDAGKQTTKETSLPLRRAQERTRDGGYEPLPDWLDDLINRVFIAGTNHVDGRRKVVTVVAPTEPEEAIEALPDDGLTATEAVSLYLRTIAEAGASSRTLDIRKGCTGRMLEWCGDDLANWKRRFWGEMARPHKSTCKKSCPKNCKGHRYSKNTVTSAYKESVVDMVSELRSQGYDVPGIGEGKPRKFRNGGADPIVVEIIRDPALLRALIEHEHRFAYMPIVQAIHALTPLDPADVAPMDWSEILVGGEWTREHEAIWYKSGRTKGEQAGGKINLPLPLAVERILREMWEEQGRPTSGRVLVDAPKSAARVSEYLKEAMGASGIPEQEGAVAKRFRHTFASNLDNEVGASSNVIAMLMGQKHHDLKGMKPLMQERYIQVHAPKAVEAMRAYERWVMGS